MMMKRLLGRLTLALITFAVGVSIALIWKANRALSLCELNANPHSFAGKTIRFRGLTQRMPAIILAGSACDNEEGAWVSVEFDSRELAKLPLDVPAARTSGNYLKSIHLTDAVIIGELDPHFGPGCFGPKYHVKNARIERILSSHEFVDLESSVQWFKSNSY